MEARASQGWARTAFGAAWCAAILIFAGAVISGKTGPGQPIVVALGLFLGLCLTGTLIWWLPGPSFAGLPFRISVPRFGLLVFGAWALLYGSVLVIPVPWSLLVLVAAAVITLVALRTFGSRSERRYAGGLAVAAGVFGMLNGHNLPYLPLWQWGLLQMPLTFFGLLAGWALARRLGLDSRGMGRVHLLAGGLRPAARAALEGMLLALPFAVLAIAMGSTSTEGWATHWWAPLAAVQPAISEEAYARVFLLGLMMFLFVSLKSGALRGGWLGAILVGVYWFASLHARPWDVTSTLIVGTLFNLPLSYVWLRRGLESAMGFHFAMDGLRWLVVFLVASGVAAR